MKVLLKVFLVLLGLVGLLVFFQEGRAVDEKKFLIQYQGISIDNNEFILDATNKAYLVKKPFSNGIRYPTKYSISEPYYWLDSRLVEWRDLKRKEYKGKFRSEFSEKDISETVVVFQLEITQFVGKWLEQTDEFIPRQDYIQVEGEFPELNRYKGEFGDYYYVKNDNRKYKNKYFIISCSNKKKYISGLKPCRFNIGIDDYINVRVMFYPDRMADWNIFLNEINRVLDSISYVES